MCLNDVSSSSFPLLEVMPQKMSPIKFLNPNGTLNRYSIYWVENGYMDDRMGFNGLKIKLLEIHMCVCVLV